jgi:hypothetical protein
MHSIDKKKESMTFGQVVIFEGQLYTPYTMMSPSFARTL